MTSVNNTEFVKREADLITMIDKTLPDFAAACRAQDIPVVLLHQDALLLTTKKKNTDSWAWR